ncbi:Hypothetical predicted protein [Pelobates cultripes]|uniref:Uncharacterized protein n=1 Tax=Pelobates cultripes TaxID=61616 RepID=A0AAD1WDE9_PELCU|nr:Hypothetical predicted protein [Pelobates cultripes]
MSFPDVKLYYKAAILAALATTHRADNPPQWVAIESQWTCRAGMHHLFWVPKHLRPTTPTMLETTKLMLHTWDTYRTHLSGSGTTSLASTMYSIHLRNKTFDYRTWTNAGCTHIHDLYKGTSLKQFPDLQTQYNLPSKAIFSYLQLKSTLRQPKTPPMTPMISNFDTWCLTGKPHRRSISKIYSTLLEGTHASTDNFIQMTLTPATCLLYIWPEGLTKVHSKLLFHTLIAACNLIAKNWKSRNIPTKTELVTQIQKNWEYERMAAQQLGTGVATMEAGKIWEQYWNKVKSQTTGDE